MTELAATPEQASYALAVLAHAAEHTAAARVPASTLIGADPYRLLSIAITQVQRGVGALDHAIAAAIPGAGLDWDAAKTLYDHIGNPGPALAHSTIALTLALAHLAPDQVARAQALADHRSALRRSHRYGAAVPPACEAVTLYRELATADPRRYQPYLADALKMLACTLNLAGHPGEAVAPAREAVTLRRELTAADPDRHQHHLSDALAVLGAAEEELDTRGQDAVAQATDDASMR